MFRMAGISQRDSGMSWEKPASPSAALLFVALIKVYSGNLGNELRNNLKPVSLVHLCNGAL